MPECSACPLGPGPHVVQIEKRTAREFISCWHYLGAKPFRCSYAFGLVDTDLCGVIVFHGPSAPETVVGAFGLARNDQGGIWEIGRLALQPEYNGQNWGSFLIWRAIRLLRRAAPVRAVITYADSTWHTGGVYRASNFIYCGLSAARKDYYVDGKIKERGRVGGGEWRPRPRKHRYVYVFDKRMVLRWPVVPVH